MLLLRVAGNCQNPRREVVVSEPVYLVSGKTLRKRSKEHVVVEALVVTRIQLMLNGCWSLSRHLLSYRQYSAIDKVIYSLDFMVGWILSS